VNLVLASGWDAHLLPVRDGLDARRIRMSHDGWAELYASHPTEFILAAV
jgi:hypothetical protein